ncbi:MAG TPA: hypothetical protein VHN82_09240 [Methanoregula sp.]|nr:hypothetical protein [Methanoregula sp.]
MDQGSLPWMLSLSIREPETMHLHNRVGVREGEGIEKAGKTAQHPQE